ncbi:hypothetical protein COX21_03455 [Candidatus Falkowbacteria bacterium CG23_combo_of_CG06-09_8_20_14_all_41_10]|uniref:Type II secretion system protein GspG C-terminal domain-containing protein n=1 Tax=Candidatus Falkowbacteria bacterium CG23_combo_of_CG06-09_8_20_14_all_41_10 TaxID=1974571 RepID=A0A2G9ZME6_9BACT|nr:MAG: hypothetical protein COX21_03455 [Candidatus Falkowbacteria bacterium CG23_combo_of_CG06-09_8_20_14_all_41_10]
MKNKPAFATMEALAAVLIIGFLIVIFILFIHPPKQFADARNVRRTSNVGTILTALNQYIIDNGAGPPGVDGIWRVLGTADSSCNINCAKKIPTGIEAAGCLDLTPYLVPKYLLNIPSDPKLGKPEITYYAVRQTINGRIEVLSCGLESNQ